MNSKREFGSAAIVVDLVAIVLSKILSISKDDYI
jgi:hypothetical protein